MASSKTLPSNSRAPRPLITLRCPVSFPRIFSISFGGAGTFSMISCLSTPRRPARLKAAER